jgi:pimeloyl-ACP methyl ester carboxylesterase
VTRTIAVTAAPPDPAPSPTPTPTATPTPTPTPTPGVTQAKPTLKVKVRPGRVVARETRARVVVTVVSPGSTPTGKVTVRASGKTYVANDPEKIGPSMTVAQMTADAEEVVTYLRRTYHKKKIFLLGHSWGSVLGVHLAQAHPDWFHAYIGVGQIVNMRESEAIGYRFALDQARAHDNQEALHELAGIAPYPAPGKPIDLASIGTQRKWLQMYGGLAWGRTGFEFDVDAETLAPEYTDGDLAAIDKGSAFTMRYLLGPLTDVDFTHTTRFDLPVLLFTGRHDYSVSHELTARWFATLKAPEKKLVWFEASAHMIMQEQPGRFLVHLVEDARPFAVKAGDAAADEVVER